MKIKPASERQFDVEPSAFTVGVNAVIEEIEKTWERKRFVYYKSVATNNEQYRIIKEVADQYKKAGYYVGWSETGFKNSNAREISLKISLPDSE